MKRWALLIGINEYQISDLPNSDICVENTLRLNRLLQNSGYETICMNDQLGADHTDFPSRGNVLANLQRLGLSASADDLILFYFIGFFCHAPDTTESSILPQDAASCDDSISLEEIRSVVENSQSKWVCLFSDIALGKQNQLRSEQPAKNQAILWNSLNLNPRESNLNLRRLFQKRADSKEAEYQLLSQTLYDGLTGKADADKKGAVSVSDLVNYISQTFQTINSERRNINSLDVAQLDEALELLTLVELERLSIQRQPQRTQCFTEPVINLDLMLIPGGTFTMGAPQDELGRDEDEGSPHEVTVSTFLMGRYPITQAQWRAVAAMPEQNCELDLDPSNFKGDDHPVEQVSWHEAVEFCARLSKATGHTYRLPTEAEWEYACRAGTDTPFHFGESITTDLANYRGTDDESDPKEYPGNYGNGPKGIYRQETTRVNHFEPLANAFGLCEMHGNVWEWCQDHWHDTYDGAPIDGSAWLSEDEDSRRVLRGGSWFSYPWYCRSAFRAYYFPGNRFNAFGFRVVCEAQDS